ADIVAANLAAIKQEGVARYGDYRDMLDKERGKLDAAYICTPCEVHCEATVAALDAGLHVLTEKPMAMSEDECRRMIDAANRNERFLAVDFEVRFESGWRQVRQWVEEGRLGAVRAIHINSMWDGHKSFGDLARRRAGFLDRNGCLDCGVHMLDIARFVTCGGEWRTVHALGAWFGEEVRFSPHIAILAELDPGIIVTLGESFAFTAYIEPRLEHESFALVGQKGVVVREQAQDGGPVFRLVSESLTTCVPVSTGKGKPIARVIDALDAAVTRREIDSSLATGYDGLMAQVAMDAANRAAIEHRNTWSKQNGVG
ncbi:MAG: Gfo/Idh/MocA family oxidoreductase, partial [Verrucomicrobia bacterium]|nr:Gfo/Idh/MocA family oxidoreductase [Verrucomicrobiota bacterium]